MLVNKDVLKKVINGEEVDEIRIYHLFYDLKFCFKEYVSLLYDTSLDNFKMYRKVLLNKCEFSNVLFDHELINLLGKYFKQDFRYLDNFISFLIQYNNLNYDISIVSNRIRNVYRFNEDGICENKVLDPNKYNKFDDTMKTNPNISYKDFLIAFYTDNDYIIKMQEVYAEYLVYKKRFKEIEHKDLNYSLLHELHNKGDKDFYNYRWLAKYDGDGYGGDLLFTMHDLGIEELHEVKKQLLTKDGISNYNPTVTNNEKKIMDETLRYPNTDYYIDLVKMQQEATNLYNYETFTYKLDKDTGLFICTSNIQNEDEKTCILEEKDNGYSLVYKKTLLN